MSEHENSPTDAELLEDYWDQADIMPRLREKLNDEQIAHLLRLLHVEGYCGQCGNLGPYCCYDSVRDD